MTILSIQTADNRLQEVKLERKENMIRNFKIKFKSFYIYNNLITILQHLEMAQGQSIGKENKVVSPPYYYHN